MKKCLVILSGGQDSTTCLYWARREFQEIHTITFDYGQRHRIEIDAATKIATEGFFKGWVKQHTVVKCPVLQSTSPLVNQSEQLEQYKDWQSLPGGLEKTFVPGRNALFLVMTANRAYCMGITDLVMGICQEDFGGYPDCREVFRTSIQRTLSLAMDVQIDIHAPLMFLTKSESVKLAMTLPGCMEALAYTHTAYDGKYPPTGHDHASLLRAKGFEEAGVPDPLVVRAWREGLMTLPGTLNYAEIRAQEGK